MTSLTRFISVERRYARSVSLERDLLHAESALGYVCARKSEEILERFVKSLEDSRSVSAYTLTGVYGTGKSAFAHFLSALTAAGSEPIKKNALGIFSNNKTQKQLKSFFADVLPAAGFLRAVITAKNEPVTRSVLRAILWGASHYFEGKKPPFVARAKNLLKQEKNPPAHKVLEIIAEASNTAEGLLIIIDEMGKTLEYTARDMASPDLFFLQQIAEMSNTKGGKIIFMGLLHQSFDEYAVNLTSAMKNEWAKVQGRFEDIPFYESAEDTLRVIKSAIVHDYKKISKETSNALGNISKSWHDALKSNAAFHAAPEELLRGLYPLHPVSARALPILCYKFAQNDRSLFSFLSSREPRSFLSFLEVNFIKDTGLPMLKIAALYDYFVESAGIGYRPGFQRWVEVQQKVEEAYFYGDDHTAVLKTIGILNLLASSGAFRASKKMTLLSLVDNPNDTAALKKWEKVIEELEKGGFITYRKSLDEYRIWHGSDFDIEEALSKTSADMNFSLASLLNENYPAKPNIARRHSYETGTLRFFSTTYADSLTDVSSLNYNALNPDGFIFCWVDKKSPDEFIKKTEESLKNASEKKPAVFIKPRHLDNLKKAALEYHSLKSLRKNSAELQNDKVASGEVNKRLYLVENLLRNSLETAFSFYTETEIFYNGEKEKIQNKTAFNRFLSEVCDNIYSKKTVIINELINRRDMTSQGAKAQKFLMRAMLENCGKERLGLEGFGPETTIYETLLNKSGIYAIREDRLSFDAPHKKSGLSAAWLAVETFCLKSDKKPAQINKLYEKLTKPPFGIREPVLPVLLLAVLIKHADSLSLYHNGTFVAVIGEEHIDLLIKRPENFSIKYFDLGGLRGEYFKELETIFQKNAEKAAGKISVLGVVKPFIKFVNRLPDYTKNTGSVSVEAKNILNAVLIAREPDELLFHDIPRALGYHTGDDFSATVIKDIKDKLREKLVELQTAYEKLVKKCRDFLFHSFTISSEIEKIREELRVRSKKIINQCAEPVLKRFLIAAVDENQEEEKWLEAVIMVIADKPPASFKDEDIEQFEMNLFSLARRFQNLESMALASHKRSDGFEARKVSVTKPDGTEYQEVVYIENKTRYKIEQIISKLLEEHNSLKDKKAVLALLADKVIQSETEKKENNVFSRERKQKQAAQKEQKTETKLINIQINKSGGIS
ncbi:MAG: hypothetical protein OEZ13_03865 [Spirochaetia bacterium]|nr:hypothetical protein [Spirochaetia bacterium]